MAGIGPRRAEIIIAGATVYAGLMVHGISGFRYSPLGVRDGLLTQMAADLGGERHIQKRIQSQRERALVTVGKHYGVDAATPRPSATSPRRSSRSSRRCTSCRPSTRSG